MRQLRDQVEIARSQVLTVPNVGRVDLIGAQDEVIFLEFSTRQIASLGLDMQTIGATRWPRKTPSPRPASCRPDRSGSPFASAAASRSEDSLRAINLRVNDRFFPLSDVATIRRGYVDPPTSLFRYDGKPAIGLAIGMKPGANLLEFGAALEKKIEKDQDRHADRRRYLSASPTSPPWSTRRFPVLRAACLKPSSLFWRSASSASACAPGLVVAIAIPLVLAVTFIYMEIAGISLQRISLGALIIALGLLVDDAMIAVEMMVARLEAGDDLRKAATHVYTSTAFPMLTGTLVTAAGFVPDRPQHQLGGRIHLHFLRGHRGVADRVLVRGGAVHAADRRHACCRRR